MFFSNVLLLLAATSPAVLGAAIPSDVTLPPGVTRGNVTVAGTDLLDVIKGNVSFSSIDFSKSNLDPLGFSLETFAVNDPANADEQTLQDQLDVYRGLEFFIRTGSDGENVLQELK
ncbi:hypothetical protein BDK51DRAFT_33717, partial [Blyttiomyces helicus]